MNACHDVSADAVRTSRTPPHRVQVAYWAIDHLFDEQSTMPRSLVKRLGPLLGMLLGMSMPTAQVRAEASDSTARTLFDFHSDFWVNLHHFLYMQAVPDLPKEHLSPKLLTSVAMAPADAQALAQLSPEERTAWRSAVTYYTDTLASRDLDGACL